MNIKAIKKATVLWSLAIVPLALGSSTLRAAESNQAVPNVSPAKEKDPVFGVGRESAGFTLSLRVRKPDYSEKIPFPFNKAYYSVGDPINLSVGQPLNLDFVLINVRRESVWIRDLSP